MLVGIIMIAIGMGIASRSDHGSDGLSLGKFLVFLGIAIVVISSFVGC